MSKSEVLTVRSRYPALVLRFLKQRGGDATSIARRFDISEVDAEETRVTRDVMNDVSEAAAAELGDPFLGLHVATFAERGSYGVFELAPQTASSVEGAFERLGTYQSLVTDGTRFVFRRDRDTGILEHRIEGLRAGFGRHPNEFSIALLVRRLREVVDPSIDPIEVWFAHDRPAAVDALASFFRTDRIHFKQPFNGLSLPASFLGRPMPTSDPALSRVLDDHARALMAAVPAPDDFVALVNEQIDRGLMKGGVDVNAIAKHLGLGVRSFQRRLKQDGLSFSALVEARRRELAMVYMQDKTRPVGKVALLLGYADARAFLRAFRRWTGTTPANYRKTEDRSTH